MKFIYDSTSCLLHLLLLAELFVHSSSRPAPTFSHCGMFKSMIHQVDRLMVLSKKLHNLEMDDELLTFAGLEDRLDSLPHIEHSAAYFESLKMNESLSQLHAYTQAFRLHINGLKRAQINFSLPSETSEGASTHLLQLSNLVNASLSRISQEVPPSPSVSFPAATRAFDVVQFSIEISERLMVFCHWSKRVLRHLQSQSFCPKH